MACRALAAAQEKLLSGSRVSRWPGVVCGQIVRVYPRGKRLQFQFGESKRRHPAGRSILDHVSNLTFIAASQAATVDQSWSPIPAFSTLAVATLAALLELFFGLAEISTLGARILTKCLDRCQSDRTSKRGINRPLPHRSHHL
jgi:hypothetical protein